MFYVVMRFDHNIQYCSTRHLSLYSYQSGVLLILFGIVQGFKFNRELHVST